MNTAVSHPIKNHRHKIQNKHKGRANSPSVYFDIDGLTRYAGIFSFFLLSSHIFPDRGRLTSWDEKVSVKGRLCQLGSLLVSDTPLCSVVLVPKLNSRSLCIVWSHQWRIVGTSGLGEHVWSAAAVNTIVVTAEVSSTRTLWLKNRSLHLIPWTGVSVSLSLTYTRVHFHHTFLKPNTENLHTHTSVLLSLYL